MQAKTMFSVLLQTCPKHREYGFTIIELLVVVVVITVLSSIALPSMLAFANRARESEARSYVAAINRAQQTHYLQYSEFANLNNLRIGLTPNTASYTYASTPTTPTTADTTAVPVGTMRGFAGQVWIGSTGGAATSFAILCEGASGTVPVIVANTCP